jgi:hypothetical protein
MRPPRSIALSLVAVALPFALGCAKSPPPLPPPVPIFGKIVFANGKPVPNMVISLHAQDEENSIHRPSDKVDQDGKYVLSARPGRYKVTLVPLPNSSGPTAVADLPLPKKGDPKDNVSPMARYRDAKSSPLEITVPAAGGEIQTLTVN